VLVERALLSPARLDPTYEHEGWRMVTPVGAALATAVLLTLAPPVTACPRCREAVRRSVFSATFPRRMVELGAPFALTGAGAAALGAALGRRRRSR
jgi:hypothetical protein